MLTELFGALPVRGLLAMHWCSALAFCAVKLPADEALKSCEVAIDARKSWSSGRHGILMASMIRAR